MLTNYTATPRHNVRYEEAVWNEEEHDPEDADLMTIMSGILVSDQAIASVVWPQIIKCTSNKF